MSLVDGLDKDAFSNYIPKPIESNSPIQSFMNMLPTRLNNRVRHGRVLKPFSTDDIRVLLLENINQAAVDMFAENGYNVEYYSTSLPKNELIRKIRNVNILGIGPETKLTEDILKNANDLICIGCFCIGTSHVDLKYATSMGIAVFNSPFSNSRSVAEFVISEVIALSRQITDRSNEMHEGTWNRTAKGCWEIRGKTLGIIGYGHIGSQVSVIAEAIGMKVIYYDIVTVMSLGTAEQVPTLEELLENSDFVSICVPENRDTLSLVSYPQFNAMKTGSYLINSSRGSVVDIDALIYFLESKKLAGAALDVFPEEPGKNGTHLFTDDLNPWVSKLTKLPNVILTPHIGGSTEEGQNAIGKEVSKSLINFTRDGNSSGSVNFPEVCLKNTKFEKENTIRVLYIHKNIPGVLRVVNNILSEYNIEKQYSDSSSDLAYLMVDISSVSIADIQYIYSSLENTAAKISVRIIF